MSKPDAIPGGWGPTEDANEEIQILIDKVKTEVEKAAQVNFAMFVAYKYRQQVVAGMNYLVRVTVEDAKYIDVEFYVPLTGKEKYEGYQGDKSKDDPLEPFPPF